MANVAYSFTVKLVSKIIRVSWGSFPMMCPIDVIAGGGMFTYCLLMVIAIIDGVVQRGNHSPHG